jgi:hypothetical protein
VHPKHNGLTYTPKWGHIYMIPRYKRQFDLFDGAGALWSLNINQDTDNIHEISSYSMHLSPIIYIIDTTIQYNQLTMQFDPLTYFFISICVDFACFYVEFAFRHYAKKKLEVQVQIKKIITMTPCKYLIFVCSYFRKILIRPRPDPGWWMPQPFGFAKLNFL